MDTLKTCPACHKENQQDAAVCAFCAAPLLGLLPARTTESVPDVPLTIKPPDHIIQLTKLYSDILVLVVLGQEQPLLIKGPGMTMLGRYSPGEATPSVDLTPYNANLLGVSRQHATISRSETGYVLEDIGSTNGTWLNEVKLIPNKPSMLKSGDLVRLGQLGLYVYFDLNRGERDSETQLVLKKEKVGDANLLTTDDLSTHLLPYLNALIGIQSICDSLAGRKPTAIGINALSFDPETAKLRIKLNGADVSYRLLQTKIAPWKVSHQKQIVLVSESNNVAVAQPSPPTSPLPGSDGQDNLLEGLRQEYEKAEAQFARDLVNELAPDRSEGDKKELADKLLPHIHNLALNSLQLAATD